MEVVNKIARNNGINTNTNKYRQVRNSVMNKARTLNYPIDLVKKIKRILNRNNTQTTKRNNINRAYARHFGVTMNQHVYNARKRAILKQLNSLPVWNTRRHNRTPFKIAKMIRLTSKNLIA
jgi:hypothetical protein